MVYGTDPFSAQNATNNGLNNAPSVFGALPYPASAASANPSFHTLVTFRFTSFNPSMLDCSVFGPNNETCYRVVTGGQGFTLLKNAAGQNIAVIEWQSHPTVEARAVGAKQPVGQWLILSPDKRVRMMVHGRAYYTWTPVDRFLLLSLPGTSEWLARVTKTWDAVVLELSARAIELGLVDAAVLATVLLQSGKHID